MKYLWILIPLVFTGCSSIKFVTTDHGHLVTDRNEPVKIIGNPPVACHLVGFNREYSGYFVYQDDDGSIFLDDYGRGMIQLQGDVVCRLLSETR